MQATGIDVPSSGTLWAPFERFGKRLEGDRVIWMVTLFLSLLSLLAVYSAISSLAFKDNAGSLKFLGKQAFMIFLGWGVMVAIHRMNFRYFARAAAVLFYVAIALLLLTWVMGENVNDARRWIRVPGVGLTFQPSDFAKVVLIAYVARTINQRRDQLDSFRHGVLPVLIPIGIICGLILPDNLSTAALLATVCLGMLFVAGTPLRHMVTIGALGAGALFGIYSLGKAAPEMLPRFSTWASRIEQFAGSDAPPATAEAMPSSSSMEYQIELAQVAIHRGGLLPHGPGTGTSRNFLPHPYSDMIFAFIVEEWGAVLGGLGLVLLYLILLYRSLRVAYRCKRFFGALLATGLSFMLVVQAMTNMAVAVRLFPTTGQPLPVVSYGGTSLLFTCLSIGIILAISRSVTDPEGWERAHGVPA